ncbi:hypothetical protein CAPTEDRAFT_161485 [Capitella teleta]|uniref:P/Homo B domain-containing protein n=1 Tax=Capitella teleta TaxID=283909 RepID=R7TUZ6_CAPTE|nr:hypothetical protein CAPTEDRAFT_161485 [Capitella teleta]|eukprot:ELT97733.1 hypothetical protein CAPTEDRAFT_161485 [Capitella teleta]
MVADLVALETNLDNLGQIGEFRGHYYFAKNNLTEAEWWRVKEQSHQKLDSHHYVQWHMQQLVRSRQKRSVEFNDPMYHKQWHLRNRESPGYDINVTGVWEYGITGKGVTTAVIDDGLEWTNPDLRVNYSPEGSWDLNSNDADPMPHGEKEKNHHGTRCAGEIAAVADNSICGVGVAYGAKVAGIRVLDGPMTDSLEATAFMKGYTINDVYSCSWGPDDDGKTVDGPHYLAMRAMRLGVDYGRGGYGAIYVVASGNGGQRGDNCNYDGYANSIYTLTIGAVDEVGSMPFYAEECASMLAVTYSSGSGPYQRSIVTTDWMKDGGTGCTEGHTGTSAAAPIAAGIIALMLEAQPCLTWRDVQHLVVMTADKVDVDLAHWTTNAAGLHHSHKHGFGLMNAWALVNAAKAWEPVPWMTVFTSDELDVNTAIPGYMEAMELQYAVTKDRLQGYQLFSLEYVQAIVTIDHDRRGDVQIKLRCPSGTESILGASRPHDDSRDGFQGWTFSTVRCWGENPIGKWTLLVSDTGRVPMSRGHVVKWRLKLFGSPMTTDQVRVRRTLARDARSGRYLRDNITSPCQPPPLRNKMVKGLSERILKVLTLCSAFCAVMGIYQSLEYAFCYDDEKRSQYKLIGLVKRAQRLAEFENQAGAPDTETSRLLPAEVIPLIEVPQAESTDDVLSDSIYSESPSRESRMKRNKSSSSLPSSPCDASKKNFRVTRGDPSNNGPSTSSVNSRSAR